MTEPYTKGLTSSNQSMESLVENDMSWLYLNMKQFTTAHFTQSTLLFPASFHVTVLQDSSSPALPHFTEEKKEEDNNAYHDTPISCNIHSTNKPRLPFKNQSEDNGISDKYSFKAGKNSDRAKFTKHYSSDTTSLVYPSSTRSNKSQQYSLNPVAFHKHEKKVTPENYTNEDKSREKILKPKVPFHVSTDLKSHENKIHKDNGLISCYSGETVESYAKRWCNLCLKRLDLPPSKSAQIAYLQKLIKPILRKGHFQILESEKKKIRSELIAFDRSFRFFYGELPTSDQKKPLKPLYGYYRRLKLLLEQLEIYYKNKKKNTLEI